MVQVHIQWWWQGVGVGGASLSRCHQNRDWKMPGEEGESLVGICWKCILGSQCKGPGAEAGVACLATRRSGYGWSRESHGEGNRMWGWRVSGA